MERPHDRSTEELLVGSYALVALLSGIGVLAVQHTGGPPMGGSFLVIGLLWICVVAAIAMAISVLVVNANRLRHRVGPDLWSSGLAVLILVTLGLAVTLGFTLDELEVSFLFGAVGLIAGPAALFAVVFHQRTRGLVEHRVSIRERTE